MLRVSTISGAGIGVFALHGIAQGVWLEVFPRGYRSRKFKGSELPEPLRSYCTAKPNDLYAAPRAFNRMSIGWYLNHSEAPNVVWDDDLDGYAAARDIAEGEELFIDYNLFEEPLEKKGAYYAALPAATED
ncbi:MAG: SET domain-containing protein-lysine N-methyltransferase [Myxococcales bacterium]|nr:MAG: SET domain-containing protein-lysine N-methyltransferase [Myxococcales bacterium]